MMSDPSTAEVAHGARTYAPRGVLGRVIELVGRKIVAGTLAEGAVLPSEGTLAQDLGVSRTALREAVKVLSAKGLVESRQRLGIRVRPARAWNLLDADVLAWHAAEGLRPELTESLVELRRLVEPAAARLAAVRRSSPELRRILAAFAGMAASTRDAQAYHRADVAFHEAVFAACGNPFMERLGGIVGALLGVSFAIQRRSLIPMAVGLELHEPVLRAIEGGDAEAAERAMLAIIDMARLELARAIGEVARP